MSARLLGIVREMHDEFRQIRSVVEEEGAIHRFPGLRHCEKRLRGAERRPEAEIIEAVEDVISIWTTLNAGYGSFSDFYLWRDDFDERVRANEEFEKHTLHVRTLIDEYRTL